MKDKPEGSAASFRNDGLTDDLDLSDLAVSLQAEGSARDSLPQPVLEVVSEIPDPEDRAQMPPHTEGLSGEDDNFIEIEDILLGSPSDLPRPGKEEIPSGLVFPPPPDPQGDLAQALEPEDWMEEQDLGAEDVPDFSASAASKDVASGIRADSGFGFREEESLDLLDVGDFLEDGSDQPDRAMSAVTDMLRSDLQSERPPAHAFQAQEADVLDLSLAADFLDSLDGEGEKAVPPQEEDVLDLSLAADFLDSLDGEGEKAVPPQEADVLDLSLAADFLDSLDGEGEKAVPPQEADALDLSLAGDFLDSLDGANEKAAQEENLRDLPLSESFSEDLNDRESQERTVLAQGDSQDLEGVEETPEEKDLLSSAEVDDAMFEENLLDLDDLLETPDGAKDSGERQSLPEERMRDLEAEVFTEFPEEALEGLGLDAVTPEMDGQGEEGGFSEVPLMPESGVSGKTGKAYDLAEESWMPDTDFVPLVSRSSDEKRDLTPMELMEERLSEIDFEAMLERVVRKVFSEKLDAALMSVVERAVEKEIHSLKKNLYED